MHTSGNVSLPLCIATAIADLASYPDDGAVTVDEALPLDVGLVVRNGSWEASGADPQRCLRAIGLDLAGPE